MVSLGMQNVLGGFLLSILSGNEARFLKGIPAAATAQDGMTGPSLAPQGLARS
jgi:hypothetical protein